MKLQYYLYKVKKYENNPLKTIKYLSKLNQKGGQLINNSLDFSKEDAPSIVIKAIEETSQDKRKENLLGQGEFGYVYLLTNNCIIKIVNNLTKFEIERKNNLVVNKLSAYNPFFPKFYLMFTKEIIIDEKLNRGVIVSEKLLPIFIIINNENFKEKLNKSVFYKQLYFLFYSIKDFYERTGNILVHNDVKMDNIMLRQIQTSNDFILFKLANGIDLKIPLIIIDDIKYHLVLIDFGESYSYNSETKIENYDTNSVFNYKYFTSERRENDFQAVATIVKNMSFLEYDLSYFRKGIEKIIKEDGLRTKIFKSLKEDIKNIDNKFL